MTLTLKEHRQKAYLSVREMAAKAGVGSDTVWRIENGDYKQLRPSTMRRVAEALNVHPSDITEFVTGDIESVRDAVQAQEATGAAHDTPAGL